MIVKKDKMPIRNQCVFIFLNTRLKSVPKYSATGDISKILNRFEIGQKLWPQWPLQGIFYPRRYLSLFNSKIRLLTLTVNIFETKESIFINFSAYERKFIWLLFKTIRFEIR